MLKLRSFVSCGLVAVFDKNGVVVDVFLVFLV